MSAEELDALLTDLERSMNTNVDDEDQAAHQAVDAHSLQSPTTSLQLPKSTQKTPGLRFTSGIQESGDRGIPTRCSDASNGRSPHQDMSAVATHNPVRQNMNELDVLLQDLSNAKFSEQHVEQHSVSKMFVETKMTSNEQMFINGSSVMSQESKHEQQNHESSSVVQGVRPTPPSPPVRQHSVETRQQRNMSSTSVRYPASSATQELDDLMMSLNTFKIKEGAAEEPVQNTLDDMLGNLQEDMDKQGIRATQKGICSECQKPIVGQVITALGNVFHPEHFTCATCNQELGTKNFFERDGKPYCELDYHRMFSPRCAACEGPILDKCVSALDKTWHPEHFVCQGCSRPFGDDGYHERDEKAFCKECYHSAFAPKCGGCSMPITENYISSLDRPWHPTCFVCKQCKQPFVDGNFYEHDGAPYCEMHYYEMRGTPCAGCGKPISGRCITAMFRKFHPEHFVCSFCLKQLNKGTFKENGDKPYCHGCFDRLFG